ncbi:MAG: bifunctional 5,10-methylenetetrahydrofolate dehydrogenase/5,10-methenyltetrahydrofolate cyclohydrolase [Patescibacteria group bacterium]|jgi:methylenetetrahydrofolate dehydrogenase (NADP+)/methenyltetrahydrofolate cyclohydrolase
MKGKANIIDGNKIAESIRAELTRRVADFSAPPGLAIILIGDDPGSHTYVHLKEKAAREIGIYFEKHLFPANIAEKKIIDLIESLNKNSSIHGIVVQFPLPSGWRKDNIIDAISVEKDVDGFHPDNVKALLADRPLIVPGLATGIMELIQSTGVPLQGKQAVILANSKVFSGPLGHLLRQQGVAVSACNPEQADCQLISQKADILVVAIGRPGLIKAEVVKKGAIVIDVGYNRVAGRPVGDVDFDSVQEKAGWITPVPGGVGPMTVAMLLKNVFTAYEKQK